MLFTPYDPEALELLELHYAATADERSLDAIAEDEIEIRALRGTRVHLDAYELAQFQTNDDPEFLADVGSGMALDFGPLTLGQVYRQLVIERYDALAEFAPELMS